MQGVGCSTGGMQEKRVARPEDAGLEGFMKGRMQKRKDAGL